MFYLKSLPHNHHVLFLLSSPSCYQIPVGFTQMVFLLENIVFQLSVLLFCCLEEDYHSQEIFPVSDLCICGPYESGKLLSFVLLQGLFKFMLLNFTMLLLPLLKIFALHKRTVFASFELKRTPSISVVTHISLKSLKS